MRQRRRPLRRRFSGPWGSGTPLAELLGSGAACPEQLTPGVRMSSPAHRHPPRPGPLRLALKRLGLLASA
ncbi:hypothetical protein, partial [Pseudomonas sp. FSL R10-1350]|uniref:hypothetical protein n=1 Tax=Pseudomonas sp. FSL R10-1350 TaxID=2662197 RepID=UPI001C49B29C